MCSDQNPTLDNVLEAIQALYVNPDNNVKEKASKWLCEFQKSVYAWEIADRLLYLNGDLNTSYFGAQTMRIKIQVYFTELPTTAHKSLKDSLLNHVQKLSADAPNSVANQLCLAVADLFCQMVQWEDPISDIINSLSSNDVSSLYLIDVLRFISEEMNSKVLRLGQNRRKNLTDILKAKKALVLDFLSFKIDGSSPQTLARIFNCLSSWWDCESVMEDTDIRVTPLLEGAFYVLNHPEESPDDTYEAAAEWIKVLVYVLEPTSKYVSEVLPTVQTNIYELVRVLETCCMKAAAAGAPDQQLFVDRASILADLFAALGTTLRLPMVMEATAAGSGHLGDLRTFECILAVLEAPAPVGCRHNAISTFDAIRDIADEAYRCHVSGGRAGGDSKPSGDASNTNSLANGVSNSEWGDSTVPQLVPFFVRVVVALTRFCPSNSEDLESAEDLATFREHVRRLMEDVVHVVGCSSIFVELCNHLKQLKDSGANGGSQRNVLLEVEACFFMLSTVASRIPVRDPNGRISALVTEFMVPALTLPHPGATNQPAPPSSLLAVGCMLYLELDLWITNPKYCPVDLRRQIVNQMIRIIDRAVGVPEDRLEFGQKEAVQEAYRTLGHLAACYRAPPPSNDNGTEGFGSPPALLDEHWDDLVLRVFGALPRLAFAPCDEAVRTFADVARGLIDSVAPECDTRRVDPLAARALFPQRLSQLLSVPLDCLTKLMDQNAVISSKDSLADPCVWLDYLASVFRGLQKLIPRLEAELNGRFWPLDHPTPKVLQESAQACVTGCVRVITEGNLWPVLARVLDHYATKFLPMERCSRVIRFLVRAFNVYLSSMLPDIAQKLIQAFETGKHSCFLYLAGVLVDVFGDIDECNPGLVGLFEALAPQTLASLSGSLAEQPCTIEDFYRLCVRLVQHCTKVFLPNPNIDLYALLDTALLSIDQLTVVVSDVDNNNLDDSGDKADGSGDEEDTAKAAEHAACATAAVSRFFEEVIIATDKTTEDEPADILKAASVEVLPKPGSEEALGARRVLVWLLKMNGGQRLTTTCIHTCCLGLPDDRFPEMATVLFQLHRLVEDNIFGTWMDEALRSLPVVRADGIVQATQSQLAEFRSDVLEAKGPKGVVVALDKFVVLFR